MLVVEAITLQSESVDDSFGLWMDSDEYVTWLY